MTKPSQINVPAAADDIKTTANSKDRLLTPARSDVQSDVPYTPGDIRFGTPSVNPVYRDPAQSNAARASTNIAEGHTGMLSPIEHPEAIATRGSSIEVEKETPARSPLSSTEQALSGVARAASDNETLSAEQFDKTELRIRLGPKSLINRSFKLSRIDRLDNLFEACVNRWKDRLNGETPLILAYLPKNLDGVTEFTPDFQVFEFLQLIKNERGNGVERDLFVSMILLRNSKDF